MEDGSDTMPHVAAAAAAAVSKMQPQQLQMSILTPQQQQVQLQRRSPHQQQQLQHQQRLRLNNAVQTPTGRPARRPLPEAVNDTDILMRLFDPDRKQKPLLWEHIKLVAPGPINQPPPGQGRWRSKDAVAAYCLKCQCQFSYSKGTSKTISRHMVSWHGYIEEGKDGQQEREALSKSPPASRSQSTTPTVRKRTANVALGDSSYSTVGGYAGNKRQSTAADGHVAAPSTAAVTTTPPARKNQVTHAKPPADTSGPTQAAHQYFFRWMVKAGLPPSAISHPELQKAINFVSRSTFELPSSAKLIRVGRMAHVAVKDRITAMIETANAYTISLEIFTTEKNGSFAAVRIFLIDSNTFERKRATLTVTPVPSTVTAVGAFGDDANIDTIASLILRPIRQYHIDIDKIHLLILGGSPSAELQECILSRMREEVNGGELAVAVAAASAAAAASDAASVSATVTAVSATASDGSDAVETVTSSPTAAQPATDGTSVPVIMPCIVTILNTIVKQCIDTDLLSPLLSTVQTIIVFLTRLGSDGKTRTYQQVFMCKDSRRPPDFAGFGYGIDVAVNAKMLFKALLQMSKLKEFQDTLEELILKQGRDRDAATLRILSEEEWFLVSSLAKLVRPFADALETFTSEKFPTVGLCFLVSRRIRLLLNRMDFEDNSMFPGYAQYHDAVAILTECKNKLLTLFEQKMQPYVKDNPALLWTVPLDPRLIAMHELSGVEKLTVKHQLANEVAKTIMPSSKSDATGRVDESASTLDNVGANSTMGGLFWGDAPDVVDTSCEDKSKESGEEAVQRYFANVGSYRRIADPIIWWKANKMLFPDLTNVAAKWLGACASVTEVKLMNDHIALENRNSMLDPRIHSWMFINENYEILETIDNLDEGNVGDGLDNDGDAVASTEHMT